MMIKFRGRSIADNELITGGIVSYEENGVLHTFIINFNGQIMSWVEVYPDCIHRLAYIDSANKEVYENDTVEDSEGKEYFAVWIKCFWDETNYKHIPDWGLKNIYLKEDRHGAK